MPQKRSMATGETRNQLTLVRYDHTPKHRTAEAFVAHCRRVTTYQAKEIKNGG